MAEAVRPKTKTRVKKKKTKEREQANINSSIGGNYDDSGCVSVPEESSQPLSVAEHCSSSSSNTEKAIKDLRVKIDKESEKDDNSEGGGGGGDGCGDGGGGGDGGGDSGGGGGDDKIITVVDDKTHSKNQLTTATATTAATTAAATAAAATAVAATAVADEPTTQILSHRSAPQSSSSSSSSSATITTTTTTITHDSCQVGGGGGEKEQQRQRLRQRQQQVAVVVPLSSRCSEEAAAAVVEEEDEEEAAADSVVAAVDVSNDAQQQQQQDGSSSSSTTTTTTTAVVPVEEAVVDEGREKGEEEEKEEGLQRLREARCLSKTISGEDDGDDDADGGGGGGGGSTLVPVQASSSSATATTTITSIPTIPTIIATTTTTTTAATTATNCDPQVSVLSEPKSKSKVKDKEKEGEEEEERLTTTSTTTTTTTPRVVVGSPGNLNDLAARTLISSRHQQQQHQEQHHHQHQHQQLQHHHHQQLQHEELQHQPQHRHHQWHANANLEGHRHGVCISKENEEIEKERKEEEEEAEEDEEEEDSIFVNPLGAFQESHVEGDVDLDTMTTTTAMMATMTMTAGEIDANTNSAKHHVHSSNPASCHDARSSGLHSAPATATATVAPKNANQVSYPSLELRPERTRQAQGTKSPGVQCALLQLDAPEDDALAPTIPLMAEVQGKGVPLMAATEAYEEQCWDAAYEDLTSSYEASSAATVAVTSSLSSSDPRVAAHCATKQGTVSSCRIQPLTRVQLQSLYYNNELALNVQLVSAFVQDEFCTSNHEFDEILTNYYRACKKLINAENTVRLQQENHKKYRKGLWETVQEHIVVQGYCKDNAMCVARHLYEKSEMDHALFEKIGKTLQSVRNSIEDDLSLQAYSAQLSRLQVESYIHNLFRSLPILQKIRTDGPVRVEGRQGASVLHQVNKLKECISILFSMHRRPIEDQTFVDNLRAWTERLVSVLLRVASFEDHLFLLNHILRCPAGVGSWAAQYIQIPVLVNTDETTFVSDSLDHMVTVLATILQPIKGREQFLQHLNISLKDRTENTDGAWIMVDSDGEENEDPKNAWQYLRENDVVNMLGQVPLNELFQHVLMMAPDTDGSWVYDVSVISESIMMRTFAFFTCLVDILSCGLKTFSLSRYRQLNKRIGRMITQIMLYTSDHWLCFRQCNHRLPLAMLDRLQVEFDQLFLRAVHCILNAERMGSWQYMTDMPYSSVSLDTTWKLMWMLHMGQNEYIFPENLPSVEQCKAELKDPLRKAQLADSLQKMPISEAIYLLTAFSNMVQCRHDTETEFIQTITVEVFEIAYLFDHTKDFCSKVGRELLSAIAQVHPVTISYLIHKLKEVRGNIGGMALYLFKELPMHDWQLDNGDLAILRSWLVSTDLGSTEHLLGRTILSNLNWGLNRDSTDLALAVWIHQYVACVLVEAYHNYITSKHLGAVFMEGVKQVALVVRYQQTNEQQFCSWAWEVLYRLHLHSDTLPRPPDSFAHIANLVDMENIPELRKDTFLAPVQQGLKVDNPIAMYVAMTMTKYGHDVAEFITHGIPVLSKLNNLGYTKAVIHIIGHCVPMFYNQSQYLIENQEFLKALHNVLLADETLMRVAKNLISSDFPAAMTKTFNSMIMTQIQATNTATDAATVISLWAHLMLKIPKWSSDRNCCYVLDNLVRCAFSNPEALKKIETLISEQYQCMLAEYRSQGVVESFVNWIAAGQNMPSFMEKHSLADAPWLAYLILTIEGKFEECTLLWPTIQQELLSNTKISVEQAWKKSAVKLKLKTFSAFHRLNIYRWAHQAVDTPCEHPILPLIWQRFFVLFLGRSITPGSLPERASNGNRFFESLTYRNLLKKMKTKLGDIVQHHIAVLHSAKGSEEENTGTPVMSESSSCLSLESLRRDCDETAPPKKSVNTQLHAALQRVFESFQFWLEEPRLHEATLYLPALPAQYDPERLQKIFFCDKNPWLELIDMNLLMYESGSLAVLWTEEITVSYQHQYKQKTKVDSGSRPSTAAVRILSRLKTHSVPVGPPPITDPPPPVPEVTVSALEEKATLMYIINTNLKILCNHARNFSSQVSRHITMDLEYLDFLPQLYTNEWNQIQVTLECRSSINFTHKCSGAITTSVRVCEKTLNADIQKKLSDIEGQQQVLVQEGLQPPPQKVCVAAVHVENIITTLIKLTRARTDIDKIEHLQGIGCAIFYYLANMVTNETNFYPPTRQFFASCLDILGQEFVQEIPDQSPVLLNFVLDHPDLAGLMSPHFLPNLNPGCFLAMYEKLIVLRSCQIDMAFMLLSKFDVCVWLENLNLPHPEVVKLIDVLSTAFISCGAEPMSRELILFELFCSHLHKVLHSCFHYYLAQILSMLLKVSSKGRLHVKCWQIFSETAFPYVTECATPGSFDEDAHLLQLSNISTAPSAAQLSQHQLGHILDMMSSFFMELRLLNKESCTFGLYSKWHKYVPYIASISAGFLKILAAHYHDNISEQSPAQVMDYLWTMIVNVFSPWIRPLKGPAAQTQFLIPWTAGDQEAATIMVQNFCDAIRYIHTFYKSLLSPAAMSRTQDILGRLWIFYTSTLASRKVPLYCVTLLNVQLALLPWDQLTVDLQVAETMANIRDTGNLESFQLVKVIAPHVNWSHAMQDFIRNYPPNVVSKFTSHLFYLFLQLAGDDKDSFLAFTEEVALMFVTAEKLCWDYLDSSSFTQSVNWYLQHCDPKAILAQRSSLEALELRLIQSASKFDIEGSIHWTRELSKKRVCYVYCMIQLLCQCSYQESINEETFSNTIINILTQIETVQMAVADRQVQKEESVDMMKTVYILLNSCNPEGSVAELITSTLYSWLESSIHSILLVPAITAACRALANLTNVVQVLEKCIDVYFTSDENSTDWATILSNVQIPELNLSEFIDECLQQGAFLTLYVYLLQQLSVAVDSKHQLEVVRKVLVWSSKGNSSSDNEGKLLLWWHKCFSVLVLLLEGDPSLTPDIAHILTSFIHMLTPLAEDKDTTGLLGAIGLGRRSTLSIKFRLTCRALYVFLQTTLHPDLTLRVSPEMSIVLHSPEKQALNSLRNLKTNRQYGALSNTITYCSDFIVDPANTFQDSVKLIGYLARTFYSHKGYWVGNLPPVSP